MGSTDERDAVSYPYEGFDFGSISMRMILFGDARTDGANFAKGDLGTRAQDPDRAAYNGPPGDPLPLCRCTCYILIRASLRRIRAASRRSRRRALRTTRKFTFAWGTCGFFWPCVAVILAWASFRAHSLSPWWLAAPVVAFVGIASITRGFCGLANWQSVPLHFYERGLARIEDRWAGSGETGERFDDPHHVYAADLDLFGKGSLFQLLSTARTRMGEDTLARVAAVSVSRGTDSRAACRGGRTARSTRSAGRSGGARRRCWRGRASRGAAEVGGIAEPDEAAVDSMAGAGAGGAGGFGRRGVGGVGKCDATCA